MKFWAHLRSQRQEDRPSPKTTFVMQGNHQTSHSFKENVGNKNPLQCYVAKITANVLAMWGSYLVRFCHKNKQNLQRTGGRPTPIPSTGRVSKAAVEPTGGNDVVGVLATPLR